MQICSLNSNLYSLKSLACNAKKQVSFKGHQGVEVVSRMGRQALIQETAFFRQHKVLEFVKDFIEKNFSPQKTVKILDGACSTGEETWSLAMLLKGKNVDITGFGLGKQAIKKAKAGRFTINDAGSFQDDILFDMPGMFSDSFLSFNNGKILSTSQTKYRELFKEFFEEVSQTEKEKFIEIYSKIFEKIPILNLFIKSFESKHYMVKPSKIGCCKFIEGNIKDLDKLANDGTVDVFLFRNAMYHMCYDGLNNLYYRNVSPENKLKPVFNNLFKNIHKKISPKGIFVIGQNEILQTCDDGLTQKLLKENGFNPIYHVDPNFTCVWQKA